MRRRTKAGFAVLLLVVPIVASDRPDARAIIERSVEANERDWNAAPGYNYTERDRERAGTKTFDIEMIEGSPYQCLIAVNGHPLPPAQKQEEQRKLQETISKRRSETPDARADRIAEYERDRKRDHLLMDQLTAAFNFALVGQRRLGPYQCYVLDATPRGGYRPPNTQTEVLTGMRGRLWIDKDSYQWVKVEAMVIRPVSIEGFLARVEPGTRFELEKGPVGNGIWLPKHFSMSARAKVLFMFTYRSREDASYFDYRKAGALSP